MDKSPLKTPTKKRPRSDSLSSPRSSPKFMKPSELFRRRLQQQRNTNVKKNFSPSKATAALRRCKLPIETVEKIYSPLKCLQQQSTTNNNPSSSSSSSSTKSPKQRTFSPLMKKLLRSPRRCSNNNNSQISFPVVRRSLSQVSNGNNKKNTFTRVLDFNDENAQISFPSFQQHQQKNVIVTDFYPLCSPQIDWSLKTRMKIVFNRSIPFNGTFNSLDESNGLNQFVRGTSNNNNDQQSMIDNSIIDSTKTEQNFCSELQRNCLVWQYPHLSWMRLFPRQPELKPGSHVSSMKPPMFQISSTGSIADSLYSDFCIALHSLFKLLKTKYCPYFYLCANNFTILFRASGITNANDAHALITPTTIGFRRLLETEGIPFEMPFYDMNQSSSSTTIGNRNDENSKTSTSSSGIEMEDFSSDDDDNDEDINDNDEKDEESSNLWLESLGLSQQDFPSLETSSLRRRRLMTSSEDGSGTGKHRRKKQQIEDQSAQGKVRSLIRVNGIANLQSLLGLFINQRKICISTSGPLAGIPPTILAPVAFHGACLRPIIVRHKTVNGAASDIGMDSNNRTITTLDFNGPILPNVIYGLKQLLRRLFGPQQQQQQQENSTTKTKITIIRSTLRTYDQSASFALESGLKRMNKENLLNNPTFSVENLQESGMDRGFLMAICLPDRQYHQPIGDFELLSQGIRYNRFVSGILSTSTTATTKPLLVSTSTKMTNNLSGNKINLSIPNRL